MQVHTTESASPMLHVKINVSSYDTSPVLTVLIMKIVNFEAYDSDPSWNLQLAFDSHLYFPVRKYFQGTNKKKKRKDNIDVTLCVRTDFRWATCAAFNLLCPHSRSDLKKKKILFAPVLHGIFDHNVTQNSRCSKKTASTQQFQKSLFSASVIATDLWWECHALINKIWCEMWWECVTDRQIQQPHGCSVAKEGVRLPNAATWVFTPVSFICLFWHSHLNGTETERQTSRLRGPDGAAMRKWAATRHTVANRHEDSPSEPVH